MDAQLAGTAAPSDEQQLNPPDFKGEVETNNELPSAAVLRAVEDHTVIDSAGKFHPFKSLYSGPNVARRILVIFVRHFFCGEYLRTLSASITPEDLLGLPVSTFIAVVGCGSHELIATYVRETGCRFPVYADPTRRLYADLGMVRTLSMGPRPAYLQNKTVAHTVVSGIVQGLRQVRAGLATKSGDQKQVGGEFLFEPVSRALETPIQTPVLDDHRGHDDGEGEGEEEEEGGRKPGNGRGGDVGIDGAGGSRVGEEKCVTWCHRMRTTRDHAEIPELMEILGLEGAGAPGRDLKRWRKALSTRKGTGMTMASQMGRGSVDTAKTAVTDS
ncbi:AhpC/TSA antioxidant enzyme-domain-containing protein [Xylaria cf. heliscus]|nr:AhpC/TSA antioxidant enzyme-domain-containing protein [Xylaria cf. heliscus]